MLLVIFRQRIDELQALWQQLVDQSDRKGRLLFRLLSGQAEASSNFWL